MKKKLISFLLVATMVFSMTACGNTDADASVAEDATAEASGEVSAETTGITYPLDTEETLTIAIMNDKPVAAVSKDITATPFAKAWAEQTGVNLEFIVCEDSNAMNLLFADGDLPDIVYWWPYSYAGGIESAIADGILSPITQEEMETYAPDFLKAVGAAQDDVRRTVMTDAGEYIGFPMIMDNPALQNAGGMLLREDWLREFDMEIPDTIEELEAYLQACVDKGVERPLPSAQLDGPLWYGLWTSPFGLVCVEEYQIDGKVYCGWAQPEYKEVLTWLKSLADRGLMDTSFTYYENGVYGNTMGCWFSSIGSGIGTYMAYAEDPTSELAEDFEVVAMPSLKGPNGETAMGGYAISTQPVHSTYCWITSACENKELAIQFLNYGYTEAGDLLFNFGVEGESYTMVGGVPTYTEWITHNPEGLSMQYAMAQYNRAAVGAGPFVQSTTYADQYFWREQQKEATVIWADHEGDIYRIPKYQVAKEDANEFSRIAADIDTYVAESRVKFITGEMSIDDYESVYLKTLNDMGYERYVEMLQEALDRFYAR